MNTLMGLLLSFTAVFLILLVLVQRGRGGGLAGALGGMGGQSAFGAKAGDVFTRITIGTAIVWIVLCVIAVNYLGTEAGRFANTGGPAPPADPQGELRLPPGDGDTTGGALPSTGGDATPAPTGDAPTGNDQ